MTEKPIQLGLAGLGTVGSGVYETLCRNHALLAVSYTHLTLPTIA